MRLDIARGVLASSLLAAGLAGQAQGALTVFTDRAAWEAAAGLSFQTEDFNGVATGTFGSLSTQAGLVTVGVDRLSGDTFNNPSVVDFGGSNGHVLSINLQDPSAPVGPGGPTFTTLSFGGDVNAFAADFFQLGQAIGSGATGDVTLSLGGDSVVINPSLNASGNGFFGVVSTGSGSEVRLTFARSGSLINDIFDADNVAFNLVPAPGTGLAGLLILGLGVGRRRR